MGSTPPALFTPMQDEDGNPVPGIFMVRSDDVPSFNFSMPDDLEAEGEAEEPSMVNNVSGPQAFSYKPIFFNNDGGKMSDNKQKRAKNRMEDYVDQVSEALEKRGATEEVCAEFEHDARAFKSWFFENNRSALPSAYVPPWTPRPPLPPSVAAATATSSHRF